MRSEKTTRIKIANQHQKIKATSGVAKELVRHMIRELNLPVSEITIIFANDVYLKNLHRDFLQDDSETDVMTFNLGEPDDVEGEVYISLDRAEIQAREFSVSFSQEVARLIIHGLLHLKGHNDETEVEMNEMRSLENFYINKFSHLVANLIR